VSTDIGVSDNRKLFQTAGSAIANDRRPYRLSR